MLQNLNFSQLYYFKMVVDHGSIAKASEMGNITPSAISMQIKSLEAYLGRELFSRKRRKLALTKDGKVVYEYANHLFKISGEMLSVIKEERGPKYVKIDLGVQHDIPKNLVSKITSYIFSRFKTHVTIFTKDQDKLTADVMNHEIDLAILNYPPVVSDKSLLQGKCILTSPIVLAGANNFLHLKGKDLSAFENVPMILPASHLEVRRKLEIEFARKNLEMNVVAEVDDTIIKKNMAIAGNGVIPIMEAAITNYVQNDQLHILNEPKNINDEIWLITSKSRRPHQIVQSITKDFSFLNSFLFSISTEFPLLTEMTTMMELIA